jgi:hypothetical protein
MCTLRTRSKFISLTSLSIAIFFGMQVFVTSVSLSQEVASTESQRSFDGYWWDRTSADERTGFMYALDECLAFDLTPAIWSDDTFAASAQKITAYYGSASENLSVPVQSVFKKLGATSKVKKPVPAERYGNEFWRAHNDAARRGFLEGYISCRTEATHVRIWSRPISYYLGKLNDLYNADDRHGEDAPEFSGSVKSALEGLGK